MLKILLLGRTAGRRRDGGDGCWPTDPAWAKFPAENVMTILNGLSISWRWPSYQHRGAKIQIPRSVPASWMQKTKSWASDTTGCQMGAVMTSCLGGGQQRTSWIPSTLTAFWKHLGWELLQTAADGSNTEGICICACGQINIEQALYLPLLPAIQICSSSEMYEPDGDGTHRQEGTVEECFIHKQMRKRLADSNEEDPTWACMLELLSRVQLFVTPWTVACQAPLSMEFSRHEHWSGLPFPPPAHL